MPRERPAFGLGSAALRTCSNRAPREEDGPVANLPRELSLQIYNHVVPGRTLQFATSLGEIEPFALGDEEFEGLVEWLYVVFDKLTWSLFNPTYMDPISFAVPETMAMTIGSLRGPIMAGGMMRMGVLQSYLSEGKNWFMLTNTPECIRWVEKHGKPYVSCMRKIFLLLVEGPTERDGNPVALHDAVDQVTSTSEGYEWVRTGEGAAARGRPCYRTANEEDGRRVVPRRLLQQRAIVDALVRQGAQPQQLGLAYMTLASGFDDEAVTDNVRARQPSPAERAAKKLHGFESAMKALRRLPSRSPLKLFSHPRNRPCLAYSYPRPGFDDPDGYDWAHGGMMGELEEEAQEVCELTGKPVEAFQWGSPGEQIRAYKYAVLSPPARYRGRQARRPMETDWLYPK